MKHIHFIGICGVGMSSLAILWQKKGWKVTGSDVGFYPPVSTHLEKHKINFYPGWHPDKMGSPDLVVVGNVAGSGNPEWQYARDNKIACVTYPELIAQNLVKENSIIAAGTYGKTSSAALLAWILKESGFNPAYMFGGISLNMEESADDPFGSSWSVLEGDEYKTSHSDNRAKFFSYKPTHLLLSSANWDHADIYPTEKSYLDAFRELAALLPKHGLAVVCADNQNANEVIKSAKSKIIKYGRDDDADYRYSDVEQAKDGLKFTISSQDLGYKLQVPSYGEYMAENICGCFALASEIGVPKEKIISACASFRGLKRRLEKRGAVNGADIFDDIAHSPLKAQATLATLRKIYTGKIYAIFEPNTGSRQSQSANFYDRAFEKANQVIIPRLTKIKIDKTKEPAMDGHSITKIISDSHGDAVYFEEDDALINYLKQKTRAGDAVVFLGSHGFRGMIEQLIA